MFVFNFPSYKDIPRSKSEKLKQCSHIASEVKEVRKEIKNESSLDYAIELLDVIHATETALRGIDKNTLTLAQRYVEQKNKKRGYYESGE